METASARPQCPFYGFVGFSGVMMDNKGNACALTGAHSPCVMEMAKQAPCWDRCTNWNHEGNKAKIRQFLETARVFPDELHPEGATSWEGISGLDWFSRSMGKQYS